jgi:hypothetical protein
MSVVGSSLESLESIVETAHQVRWARLSALVMMLWDHSKSSYLSWSVNGCASAELSLVTCFDKEVRLHSHA